MKKSRRDYNKETNKQNVTVHLSEEHKQQLIFACRLHNMTVSELCRKILVSFLNKNNITKKMVEYALKQILLQEQEEC